MCPGPKKVIKSYQVLPDSIFLKITLLVTGAEFRWLIPVLPYGLIFPPNGR